MTETQQDIELFALVQFEAARKNMFDCMDKEREAFEAYMNTREALTSALMRDHNAFSEWISAGWLTAAKTEEPAP